MRRVRVLAIATAIGLIGPTLVWASPASAAASLSVTPSTDLHPDGSVRVDGAGFPSSVLVLICEGLMNGVTSQDDCNGGGYAVIQTSATGTFSLLLPAARWINVSNRTVDCTTESCAVAAAVRSDIPNTVVYAPITFAPGLADGRIKRRSDGVIFGDNMYLFNFVGQGEQSRSHAIAPGGSWTYALQVQNDGPVTEDLNVKATFVFGAQPQFFVGYYDITSLVLSATGFTFSDMTPGEVRTFALRFRAPADAVEGFEAAVTPEFSSGSAGITDHLRLSVFVPTAS